MGIFLNTGDFMVISALRSIRQVSGTPREYRVFQIMLIRGRRKSSFKWGMRNCARGIFLGGGNMMRSNWPFQTFFNAKNNIPDSIQLKSHDFLHLFSNRHRKVLNCDYEKKMVIGDLFKFKIKKTQLFILTQWLLQYGLTVWQKLWLISHVASQPFLAPLLDFNRGMNDCSYICLTCVG